MKYLIKLKPLEPYFFGGDTTFGVLGDEENGTYLAKSRHFPQQSALLGMLKKEILTQANLLTRKVRGEWVNKELKEQANSLVGKEKFDILKQQKQDFGAIKSLSPIFLLHQEMPFIKKVAIDKYEYKDGLLKGYNPKADIYNNFVSINNATSKKYSDIFKEIEQIGIKKGGGNNALFKKTSYLLKENFEFGFYCEVDFELSDSIVTLGADRSKFSFRVQKSTNSLEYYDKNGYMVLLSDAYITLPIKKHCEFAITSEISFQSLKNKKHSTKHNKFEKSKKLYLYEKGSLFINPDEALIANLNNPNLQQIGYNKFTLNKGEK